MHVCMTYILRTTMMRSYCRPVCDHPWEYGLAIGWRPYLFTILPPPCAFYDWPITSRRTRAKPQGVIRLWYAPVGYINKNAHPNICIFHRLWTEVNTLVYVVKLDWTLLCLEVHKQPRDRFIKDTINIYNICDISRGFAIIEVSCETTHYLVI